MPAKKLVVSRQSSVVRKNATRKSTKSQTTKKVDGIAVDVYDTKGKVVGKTSLPKELFGVRVNPVLMAQAVRVYLANQRKGTASTKTRGEITATTAKVWRQKGTGRARHGAKSAPIWVGGGVVFGPRPRDFSLHLPKKMRRHALASGLTSQLKNKAIKIIDGLEKLEPKTKRMSETLAALTENKGRKTISKTLLVIPGKVENVQRGARNIEGVMIRPANLLTTYEVLNSNTILFMKDAIPQLLKEM